MPDENPAPLKEPLWKRAWVRIAALAGAIGAVMPLIDVMQDAYAFVSDLFHREEKEKLPTRLSGVIFDEAGHPLPDVDILVTDYGLRTQTGPDGRFSLEIENPRSDLVSLLAEKPGFRALDRDAPLGDPAINFVMKLKKSE